MDRLRARAEHREVPAGVDDALGDPAVTQHRDRPIDRIALGDAAEIDPHPAVTKGDPAVGENGKGLADAGRSHRRLVVVTRQQAEVLQHRRHRDIEHALRLAMKIERRREHLEGPGMHGHQAGRRLAVEAAHVAAVVVKAHQAVHRRNGLERRFDCGFHFGRRSSGHANLDERAQQRPGASHREVRGHAVRPQYVAASLIGGAGSQSLKLMPALAKAPRVSKVLPSWKLAGTGGTAALEVWIVPRS